MSASQLLSIAALQKTLLTSDSSSNDNEWSELALAIHRGRDHGIPSYRHALDLCENRFADADASNITFEALTRIPEEHITSLKDIYQ